MFYTVNERIRYSHMRNCEIRAENRHRTSACNRRRHSIQSNETKYQVEARTQVRGKRSCRDELFVSRSAISEYEQVDEYFS